MFIRSENDFPLVYLDDKFDREGIFFEVEDENNKTKIIFPNGTMILQWVKFKKVFQQYLLLLFKFILWWSQILNMILMSLSFKLCKVFFFQNIKFKNAKFWMLRISRVRSKSKPRTLQAPFRFQLPHKL